MGIKIQPCNSNFMQGICTFGGWVYFTKVQAYEGILRWLLSR
ncbi:hypothetical protein SAMN05518846_11193 [Brevibacillus centrosporus]|uniref:Uncharacterized protein n=1 Tax=Brevibacillus centrosporus TaxID=54910 RepID=A0A1I3YEI0_9BACL|nr:hypothetical protein SAMN05518846_11193 [Brevibacillus centrosporus]